MRGYQFTLDWKVEELFLHIWNSWRISSDDGPQFKSTQLKQFLQSWGVKNHRVSSAYHPHSNLRAETAVKSGKRLLMDNTRSDGSPDWDRVINALMQYRNTPVAEYNLSPSQLVFGRPIRDFLPIQPGQFTPSDVWVNNRETRELALRNRVIKSSERWSSGTKDLPPLIPGSQVMIQNQHGAGKKWDKTGLVLKNMGYSSSVYSSYTSVARSMPWHKLFWKPSCWT